MVFKSERNLKIPSNDEQNNLGPGEYYPYSYLKKFSINKQPFLISSPRTKLEIKDTPGPGSYYHDETHINVLKNIQSEKISKQNDKNNLLTKEINGKLSKIWFLFNTEKKGFNIKSKRFKILNNTNNEPGPGQYFKEIKKINNQFKKKKENSNKNFSIIKNELQKISTIPQKKNYGFDILNNGELIQRQNPDMFRTFTGEKGDTVGPGTYEIEKPSNWLKTGTSWSKSRSVRNCNKNDFSTFDSTTNNTEYTKNNNGITARNRGFNNTKSFELNENEKSNIIFINKSKKLNKKSIFNLVVENCKINNKKKCKTVKTFESVIKNKTPGPGYYYEEKDLSSFKTKLVPELKQFFGSKLSRFFIKNNLTNSLGPGEYFKNDKNNINMNKTSSLIFAPFSSSVERFNFSEEKKNVPGPGDYNPSDLDNIKKISEFSESKVGSKEIRFNNMYNNNYKNSIPGPGFYESKKDSQNKKNKNSKKSKIYNNSKNDLVRYTNTKINNLINNFKDKEIPPIGLYNPEIINSIDYKIKKKAYESRNNNVAFTTTFNKKNKKVKNNIAINCDESNIGPGYYYREYKKKDNRLSPAFHLPEFKNINTNIKTNIGPGEYNLNAYNDWTKKSFNINFV